MSSNATPEHPNPDRDGWSSHGEQRDSWPAQPLWEQPDTPSPPATETNVPAPGLRQQPPLPVSGQPQPMPGATYWPTSPTSGVPAGQPGVSPPQRPADRTGAMAGPSASDQFWYQTVATPPAAQPDPQPRISPSPPPQRSRFTLGLGLGLVIGLLIFGPVGFFLPRASGNDAAESAPSPSATQLGPFEQNQLALNRTKFNDDLLPLATAWLPYLSTCLTNTDKGGPRLGADELGHVLCRFGGVSVHFAQFKNAGERDIGRAYRLRLNTESRELAPGMADPARKPRTSDGAVGTYLEYALKNAEGEVLGGIWWDAEDDGDTAIYLEGRWEDTLGKSWEPLRDAWQTRS